MITRSRCTSFCSGSEFARAGCVQHARSAFPAGMCSLFLFRCRRIAGSATALALVCILWRTPALAHDTWLEPDAFFAAPGQEIAVPLRLGDHLRADEQKPLRRDAVARFQVITAGLRKRPVDLLATSQDGQFPIGRFKTEAGGSLLVMDRAPRRMTKSCVLTPSV